MSTTTAAAVRQMTADLNAVKAQIGTEQTVIAAAWLLAHGTPPLDVPGVLQHRLAREALDAVRFQSAGRRRGR